MGGPGQQENELNDVGRTSEANANAFNASALPGFQRDVAYQSELASGNSQLINQAIAPQLNQINQQYGSATQAVKQQTTRGGGEGDLTGQLNNQQVAQIANAKQSAVAQAPQALGQLGIAGGQVSNSDLQTAMQGFGAAGQISAAEKAAILGAISGTAQAGATAYAGR